MKDLLVKEIQVITNLGPRIFRKGEDFDYIKYQQLDVGMMHITLWKDEKLAHFIHASTPIVIDYKY